MSQCPNGYPSGTRLARVGSSFACVEPVRRDQSALSILAHQFVYEVGTDTAEAASAVGSIVATAHAALRGDVIRFTSGALSGTEVKVASVSTNAIVPAEDLSAAPGIGDAFQILRHKYPVVNATGAVSTTATLTPAPIMFSRSGVDTNVTKDTGTPANNRPLPIELLDTNGRVAGITASSELKVADAGVLAALPATLGQKAMAASLAVVIASDQSAVPVSAVALPLPTGAATEGTLAAASAKLPATLGQKAMAASLAVVIASDQSAVPISAASLPLPTGAALDATLAAASAKLPAALGQTTMANSMSVALASNQSSIPVTQSGNFTVRLQDGAGSAVVKGQGLMAASLPVTLASDQSALAISAASLPLPTGAALESTLSAASAKLPAALGQTTMAASMSVALASNQSTVPCQEKGRTKSQAPVRNDCSSVNITTAAYVQLTASLGASVNCMQVFDTSGQSFVIATGAAASEVDQFYVPPGCDGVIFPIVIASATRVAIKAVSGNATSGEVLVNFWQ
jgi:hypothetical protein